MPPLKKRDYIMKVLREADRPLSAQQIGMRLPSNWSTTPHTIGAVMVSLLADYDNLDYVVWVVGHGYKRFYYLLDNPKIKVEN